MVWWGVNRPYGGVQGSSGIVMGVNLNSVSYFNSEQPFLNLLKLSGSNNGNLSAWSPQGTMTYPQLLAVLDTNGYPVSLPGSQSVRTAANFTLNQQDGGNGSGFGNGLPPGAATYYPSGSYTIQFQGACTLVLGGDVASGSLATSSPNVAVAGLTITSTMTIGQSGTVTFNVTATTGGVAITVSALPDPANYFRNASIVRTSQVAAFNGGQICDPNFLSSISNAGTGGYKRLRFMDMLRATAPLYYFTLPALTPGSSLTQTISPAWTGMNVTIPVVLGKGALTSDVPQLNTATFVNGSTTVVFGSAFTQNVTGGSINLYVPYHVDWADRNPYTGFSWSAANGPGPGGKGTPPVVPYEALIEICNEANCDGWLSLPITVNSFTDPTFVYWTALATYIKANLKPGLKIFLEIANEVYLEADFPYAQLLAQTEGLPDHTRWDEWMGAQYARLSGVFSTVFGGAFASTVRIGPSTQFGGGSGTAYLKGMMNAPDWVALGHSAPYLSMTHWSCAPYFPLQGFNPTDATTLLNTTTPLDDFFACMYGNVGTVANGGNTYTSVTGGGFITSCLSFLATSLAGAAGQPWAAYPVHCYEMGDSFPTSYFSTTPGSYAGPFGGGAYNTLQKAMDALIIMAHRDPRMGLCYYDPTFALFNIYGYANANGQPGFLPSCATAGVTTMNKYSNCGSLSPSGPWGALENVMQLPAAGGSGTAASYPVYNAIQKYIGP